MSAGSVALAETYISDPQTTIGRRRVKAELAGPFAIHRKPAWCAYPGDWRVTHRATGSIVAIAHSRDEARAKLREVRAITDKYRLDWSALRNTTDAKLWPRRAFERLSKLSTRGFEK